MSDSRDQTKIDDELDFPYKCNKQIIINFLRDDVVAMALKSKWDRTHHPKDNKCKYIEAGPDFFRYDFSPKKLKINFVQDDIIRIYVIAHGSPGSDSLSGEFKEWKEQYSIDYNVMAEKLSEIISDNMAVVNLISCGAGKGSKNELKDTKSMDSFASKLHHSLCYIVKRDIPVVARTQVMQVWYEGRVGAKTTSDLDLTFEQGNDKYTAKEHKQPGSKVVYMLDAENNQIIRDCYTYSWKDKVIKALVEQSKTKVAIKKELLEKWVKEFDKMSPKDIYDEMSSEVDKTGTVLKNHSSYRYSLTSLLTQPETYKKIVKLIDKGKRLFDSEYTIKSPEPTGRKLL